MEQRYGKLGLLLMRIGRARRRAADEAFRRFDIHPAQHFLLMHLSREGSIESQSRLAQRMDVSPAFVAKSLKSLEAAGYIERADGRDLRRNETRITPAGRNAAELCRKSFVRTDESCFAGFDEAELIALEGYLERILANLNVQTKGEETY